jgi:hypothetical protein
MSTSVRYAGLRALLQAPLRALTTQDEFEIMLAFKVTIHATTPGAPPNTARSHHRIDVSVPVTYATKDQIVLDLMGEFTASTEKRREVERAPFLRRALYAPATPAHSRS